MPQFLSADTRRVPGVLHVYMDFEENPGVEADIVTGGLEKCNSSAFRPNPIKKRRNLFAHIS